MSKNKLHAVIFDWAGTLVDFGSFAPTQIFVDAFAVFGITLTLKQASGPMGLSKRHHIQTLLAYPEIQAQWEQEFNRPPHEADVDAIYERFMPMQIEKVGRYSKPIPGVIETLAELRNRGLKIGSCSGYPRQVMDVLLPIAVGEGIAIDHAVAGDDLPAGGRPGAHMALANMLALHLPNVRRCVKVDDTEPGIHEGRNAGMWTVGLALSGAPAGLTLAEYRSSPKEHLQRLRDEVGRRHRAAGAHYVIDTVAELLPVLDAIERRIGAGEHPDIQMS